VEVIIMKKTLLFLVSLASAVGVASASNDFSYTATAAPGSTPDGVDQSSNPVNVWSVVLTPGLTPGTDGEGVYEGTAFGGETLSGWQEYSYQNDGVGNGGSVDDNTTFAGGALGIGQTVSINFEMRALDAGGQAGLSLLNGSGNAITFAIIGQGPNNYYYTDAGSTDASAGSMGYQYQSEFNIAFTVTGAGTYSAVAGSDSWSGTFSGSLIGMDVFNHAGGNASDVDSNNLTVVPEPATWAMLAAGGVLMLGYRRSIPSR
jgi:hypothetical protein